MGVEELEYYTKVEKLFQQGREDLLKIAF